MVTWDFAMGASYHPGLLLSMKLCIRDLTIFVREGLMES